MIRFRWDFADIMNHIFHLKMMLQKTDSGLYECQISSAPVMSHVLHLAVTEPVTEILGGPDIYVEEGATMNLSCVVSGSAANQGAVL